MYCLQTTNMSKSFGIIYTFLFSITLGYKHSLIPHNLTYFIQLVSEHPLCSNNIFAFGKFYKLLGILPLKLVHLFMHCFDLVFISHNIIYVLWLDLRKQRCVLEKVPCLDLILKITNDMRLQVIFPQQAPNQFSNLFQLIVHIWIGHRLVLTRRGSKLNYMWSIQVRFQNHIWSQTFQGYPWCLE